MLRLALIGNPNSGKTTLFNLLTGSRAPCGKLSRRDGGKNKPCAQGPS